MIHETAIVAPSASVDPSADIQPYVVIGANVTVGARVVVFPHAVIGRPPMVTGIVPKKEYVPSVLIGDGSIIGAHAVIYQGVQLAGNVLIGDGAKIRENTSIGFDCVIGSNSTLQNDVVLGDRVRVVDLSHITAGVRVEDDVFWSVGVLSMNDNRDGEGLKAPSVGKGAFIGGGAILLPGVAVGDMSVVAAGSVVTRNVDPAVRVQGVPAKRWYPHPVNEGHDLGYDGTPLMPPPAGIWDD